jgi:hypothetical protein
MSKKLLYQLLAVLVIASIILTACGGNGNETPEPTEEAVVTNLTGEPSGSLENICGSTVWEGMTSCNDNIATIPFDEGTVLAMVYANPNPVNQDGTTKLTMDVQVTDGAGNYVASADCYYDSALHANPDYDGAIQAITSTQQHEIKCKYKGDVVAKGTLYYWYGSNLAMTLTAKAPTSTQTFTPTASYTPTVTSTLGTITVTATKATVTPTKTVRPTMTNTPTSTVTYTATPAPVVTKSITCSNPDQDVTYTVTGPIAGTLTCADGLTRQDTPVKTLVIPGAHGNMNITLDRVGGPQAMYAALITFIPGIYGPAEWTMTGTSISEGHAEVSTSGNTLIRVQDGEVVTLELSVDDFTVSAEAWLK